MELSKAERDVMEHATAWKHRDRLYRNYFAADSTHDDWITIKQLCERGLMGVRRRPTARFGYLTIFTVTEAGIAALKTKRKRLP